MTEIMTEMTTTDSSRLRKFKIIDVLLSNEIERAPEKGSQSSFCVESVVFKLSIILNPLWIFNYSIMQK